MKPKIMVLQAAGTNRDRDVAWALDMAGGKPQLVHINAIRDGRERLLDYQMLVLPGGFSYGDDLGAGKLWAVALRHRLGDDLETFIAAGRPVLGICNGFQALLKSGLLPALDGDTYQQATLTRNESGRFECRWVELATNPACASPWLRTMPETILCPVAHGEGRFLADEPTLASLEQQGMVALRYRLGGGPNSSGNPNGSANHIAGITNPAGNVLGLMPHPENHIVVEQHPNRHRTATHGLGLPIFQNGVKYASQT